MTDIEGSTRLFRELGERYVELLATHHALLRNRFRTHGGVELGTEGDSLFFVFADAPEAVAACLEGQRALATHPWPSGVELRVRIGLHTSEARPVGDGYVDLAVHQVARISSGAHGGQVLLSEATATAVEERMPAGASLVPLGSFQLRGFPELRPRPGCGVESHRSLLSNWLLANRSAAPLGRHSHDTTSATCPMAGRMGRMSNTTRRGGMVAGRDLQKGKLVASELRRLGVTGILMLAAEKGYITERKCAIEPCRCPEELGGATYFDPIPDPISDWIPTQDHLQLKSEGGKLTLENVQLAHRLCNRMRYSENRGPSPRDAKRIEKARKQAIERQRSPFQVSESEGRGATASVQLMYAGEVWADVTQADAATNVRFHSRPDGQPWSLDLDEAILAFQEARLRVAGMGEPVDEG